MPLKFRQKAKLLLNHIHSNASDRLSWDKYGVVTINGLKIDESNIIDLINDAMRSRKMERPVGRHHFASLLRSVKIPREFIGNQNFWSNDLSTDSHTLQIPNIVSLDAGGRVRQTSDSSEFFTDDTDVYERYTNKNNWESLTPLNKKKKK